MPEREELAAALLAAAGEVLNDPPDHLDESWSIEDDLGADSLDLLEIIMVLEGTFDFTAKEDDFVGVTTVGDALDKLDKLLP
jgi:acyl carrier protein